MFVEVQFLAPLLVLARPLAPLLRALPFSWRYTAGRWTTAAWLGSPLAAWVIHAVVFWGWHAPALFQATLTSDRVHSAQHLSFLGSALQFWWALLYGRGPSAYGAGVLYLFTTALHTGMLGALLTFAPAVWYPAYSQSTQAWGLTPLEDQQIGGLIMWVPAGVVYIVSGVALIAAWLKASDATETYAG